MGRATSMMRPMTMKSVQKIFFSIWQNLTTDWIAVIADIAVIARDQEMRDLTTD